MTVSACSAINRATGIAGKNAVRNSSLKECQEIIDVFFRHGHKELDTARVYAEGTTEPV